MTRTLVHELNIYQRRTPMGHTEYAACVCGWIGTDRVSRLTAQVDAKEHRLETAVQDDANRKGAR